MLIALITDFGTSDYFVGAMKGVIKSIDPQSEIIDISHEIEPQDVRAASFILRACYLDFPQRTIFLTVVDPGVGSDRKCILVEFRERFFIAPDNGLLSFIFNSGQRFSVREITETSYFRRHLSATFHGRDIFAPVAAHLSKGRTTGDFGRLIDSFVSWTEKQPEISNDGSVTAEIIYIDHFGNLVTNARTGDLPEKFTLTFKTQTIGTISKYFSEVEKGQAIAYEGSAGYVEIAVRDDSAASLLGIKRGDMIRFQKID